MPFNLIVTKKEPGKNPNPSFNHRVVSNSGIRLIKFNGIWVFHKIPAPEASVSRLSQTRNILFVRKDSMPVSPNIH